MMSDIDFIIRITVVVTLVTVGGCFSDTSTNEPADTGLDTQVDVGADGHDFTPIGSRCEGPIECGPNAACVGDPSGRYTCMKHCQTDGELCDDGSVCTARSQGEPVCYIGGELPAGNSCNSNLQCAPGLLCAGVSDGSYYCIRACEPDADPSSRCAPSKTCVKTAPNRGVCRPDVGHRCAISQDCDDGTLCPGDLSCLACAPETPELHDYFPGGYCSRIGCDTDADCPGESACRSVPDTDGPNVCLRACDQPADCRLDPGYACLQPEDCSETQAPAACRHFLDDNGLCLPDDATPW